MEAIGKFIASVYSSAGLKIINEAGEKVKFLPFAGAALIALLFAAAGVFLFNGKPYLALASTVPLIALGFLLLILSSNSERYGNQLQVLSWLIICMFAFYLLIPGTCFLFSWPKPIEQLFPTERAGLPLQSLDVKLMRDSNSHLIVETTGVPRHPYRLNLTFFDPTTDAAVGKAELRIPSPGDTSNPQGTTEITGTFPQVKCVANLMWEGNVVASKELVVEIPKK